MSSFAINLGRLQDTQVEMSRRQLEILAGSQGCDQG